MEVDSIRLGKVLKRKSKQKRKGMEAVEMVKGKISSQMMKRMARAAHQPGKRKGETEGSKGNQSRLNFRPDHAKETSQGSAFSVSFDNADRLNNIGDQLGVKWVQVEKSSKGIFS